MPTVDPLAYFFVLMWLNCIKAERNFSGQSTVKKNKLTQLQNRLHVKSFRAKHQHSFFKIQVFFLDISSRLLRPPSVPLRAQRSFFLPVSRSNCHSFLNVCKFHLFSLMEENCFLSLCSSENLQNSHQLLMMVMALPEAMDELCCLSSTLPQRLLH